MPEEGLPWPGLHRELPRSLSPWESIPFLAQRPLLDWGDLAQPPSPVGMGRSESSILGGYVAERGEGCFSSSRCSLAKNPTEAPRCCTKPDEPDVDRDEEPLSPLSQTQGGCLTWHLPFWGMNLPPLCWRRSPWRRHLLFSGGIAIGALGGSLGALRSP